MPIADMPRNHIYIALAALLLFFNVGSTVINQATLQSDNTMIYSPFVAAATTEFIKLGVAALLLCRDIAAQSRNTSESAIIMPRSPTFILKYAVPGLLYAVCNVLAYVAVSMIGSTNYQLLNNMKIITTAIIYRATLGKELKLIQWMAIMMLVLAMCVAALANGTETPAAVGQPPLRMTMGVFIMVVSSCLSASAGVYNEKLIKGTQANIWYQNVILYIWTFSFCVSRNLFSSVHDGIEEPSHDGGGGGGIFHGFTLLLWAVILMKALYGQVVSLVFKYANNILKVYANSMAVIISAMACSIFLGAPFAPTTLIAGILVILATILYYNHTMLLQSDAKVFNYFSMRALT